MVAKRTTPRALLGLVIAIGCQLSTASIAAAQPGNVVTVIPLDRTVVVDCAQGVTPSTVVLQGRLHTSLTTVANKGGDVLVREAFTPVGVSGVDSNGNVYRGAGTTSSITLTIPSGTRTTSINNFLVLGRGGAGNLVIHTVLSYLLQTDGTVQVFVDRISVSCR